MSKLRPELAQASNDEKALPNDTALFLIRDSVRTRSKLIYGQLHKQGEHCALGAFWQDHPGMVLNTSLVDEVAAVNDSVPPSATSHQRWKKVNEWLRFKIASIASKKVKP